MTVVTALAVSWNPLMNSNPNATSRARKKNTSGQKPRSPTAFQNVIHEPLSTEAEAHSVRRYFARRTLGNCVLSGLHAAFSQPSQPRSAHRLHLFSEGQSMTADETRSSHS